MPEDVAEIVITASRVYNAITYNILPPWLQYWDSLPTYIKDSEWNYGPQVDYILDNTPENHLKKFIIITSIQDFQREIEDLKAAIAFRPPNQLIGIGGAYTITVSQLKEKIESLQFVIVDKQFAGPGYGGANYGSRVEINWQVFARYAARGSYGVTYLALHEIAHNTELGLATRSWQINSYRDSGSSGFYGAGNQFFERQEAYANTIARNIATALGLSVEAANEPGFPPFGFAEVP